MAEPALEESLADPDAKAANTSDDVYTASELDELDDERVDEHEAKAKLNVSEINAGYDVEQITSLSSEEEDLHVIPTVDSDKLGSAHKRRRRWSNAPNDEDPLRFHTLDQLIDLYPNRYNIAMRLAQHRRSPLVIVSNECRNSIDQHLGERHTELGGLLLGYVYKDNDRIMIPRVIEITQNIPSATLVTTPVALELSPEVWSVANATLEPGMIVVGWYHSHPNLGAFFSGTDRYTQRMVFNHEYSVGAVIDPDRREEVWYLGAKASEINPEHIIYADRSPSNASSSA